jgi:hypothetical protein
MQCHIWIVMLKSYKPAKIFRFYKMSVQVQLHPCHAEGAGLWRTEVPTSILRSTGRCPGDNVIKLFFSLVIDAALIIISHSSLFSLPSYLWVSLHAYRVGYQWLLHSGIFLPY